MGILMFEYRFAANPPDWKKAKRTLLNDPQLAVLQKFGSAKISVNSDGDDPRRGVLEVQLADLATAQKVARTLPPTVTADIEGRPLKLTKPRVLTSEPRAKQDT